MDESNGFRWLTVSPKGQPDLQIMLMKVDGSNVQADVAASLRGLLGQDTADKRLPPEELKAKGVEFLSPPKSNSTGWRQS